ncbi:glycosyltransferase [Microseira wollei]|uniref:Glycosyl transferase group 1 n=1 Tax=Microseira wollei NIES-4236 TaxID=2530354 RepID=A0AAV3XJM6_9CYAN|nr:glycosyltransferase [Microseira wollei]GET42664.1 glycosyl transferase group 1 [Microseira wollei NIES-4236]
MMHKSKPITFLLPSFQPSGLQRVAINLIKQLHQLGIPLDVVVASGKGAYLNEIPSGVRVIDFQTPIEDRISSASRVTLPLARYLRNEKPQALVSHFNVFNVVAGMAKTLALSPVNLILVEHTSFSITYDKRQKHYGVREELLPILRRWFYPRADAVVAVSKGLAQELETYLRLKPGSVKTIYNPVIDESVLSKAKAPVEHPWFQPGELPVILGVGRLTQEKDFPTLIRAFALVRRVQPARLVILGEGKEQSKLNALIRELGLENDVAIPGFVSNPYAYMARSAAFVLSSYREGLSTVIIEALAVGIPVVSTDCPNSPAEILENGKYGELVAVGDSEAMAKAILKVLSGDSKSVDSSWLEQFALATSTQQYLQLMGIG